MDFLKKAKAKLNDFEGDLTKATHALGLGDKNDEASAPSSSSAAPPSAAPAADTATPASTTVNTPSTSVAPSVAGEAPKTKLPLAIRKQVRDEYEVKIPELEANLSAVCGVPWKLQIDSSHVYSFAEDRYSKEYPGKMITKYVEDGTKRIKEYIEKYGNEGKTELNRLASAHILTLEPVTTQPFSYCGCEISGGCLRIMVKKGMWGTNIDQACQELDKAVNAAGAAAPGASILDFDAKHSINTDYEPKISEVQAKIQRELALPVLTLTPNFEQNFTMLDAFKKSGKADTTLPREWQRRIGGNTLAYFDAVAHALESLGFEKDDMLQEGLKDAMEKNEIQLRVVEKLVNGHYNEVIFENGVMIVQTTPPWWTTNIRDCAMKVIDLL